MIKRFFTLLIFSLFIIAVIFSGCSPIGGLLASDVVDHIRAEPKRFVYKSEEYDPFIPASEDEGVEVFCVIKGVETPIAIEEVEITVKDSSWGDPIILSEVDKEEGIQLDPGIKNITISYKGMETFYRIYVGAKAGDGGNGGPGIIIKLPDDWLLD